MSHWPDEIRDDEQLYDPVDDAHRPAYDFNHNTFIVFDK